MTKENCGNIRCSIFYSSFWGSLPGELGDNFQEECLQIRNDFLKCNIMIKRTFAKLVGQRLKSYPAVALVGPRQSGKTTLAKSLGGFYFDLEQASDRLQLDLQWDNLVKARKLIILDEAQSWPELFNRLRGAIDSNRKRNGRFLLLGSMSVRQASWSIFSPNQRPI